MYEALLMEPVLVWQRLAEKWREAAEEVAPPALKRCYRARAAAYEQLVAEEDENGRGSSRKSDRPRQ
jgi:hypothetical protein